MKRLLVIGCAICIFQMVPAQDSAKRWAHYLKANVSESNMKGSGLYLADVSDTAFWKWPMGRARSGRIRTADSYDFYD